MGRAPCCDKAGLKKGPWTPEEDQKLVAYIQRHGHGSWRALPKNAGLLRCGKSCRLRWTNYLRPDIKRGRFSLEEEQMIIQLHAILGNRWSAIAGHLAGRTDNEIKNYWNTHLKKRLMQMGIDPVTHKPRMELFDPFLEAAGVTAKPLTSSLSHMAQWENARLEAEARLAREYLRFAASSRGGHVLQQPQQQLWNADDARRQFGGEQQQQLWEVESSQQPMQFASDLASQLYASSSSRFDQSPTSTLCSLEGSSPSRSQTMGGLLSGSSPSRSQTMGGLLSGSSCDSGALFHEGVAAPPRGAFGEECDGAAASGLFWSCNSKEELVIPGLSPASTIGDSELLNSSSSSRQQQDEGSPYTTTSTLDMLFDPLVDADGGCKSEQQPPLAVLEWPDVGPAHSKDYWSNVLKLVGSPVSSA